MRDDSGLFGFTLDGIENKPFSIRRYFILRRLTRLIERHQKLSARKKVLIDLIHTAKNVPGQALPDYRHLNALRRSLSRVLLSEGRTLKRIGIAFDRIHGTKNAITPR